MKLLPIEELVRMIVIAVGITYVLVGSKIGHPLRFLWCWVLDRLHISYFWAIMTCPPCNSWWTGLLLSLAIGHGFGESLQVAFATCGVVATIQAVGLSIGLGAEEDYSELIPRRDKAEEKEHGA